MSHRAGALSEWLRRQSRAGVWRPANGVLWRWRHCVGVCQIWVDIPLTLPARRRCGWPAFDRCYKGAVRTEVDSSFGMRRVEIMCSSCGGHLGHVFEGERRPGHLGYSAARPRTASSFFEGERFTQTNERHCVNSVSVRFVKASDAPLPSTEQAPVAKG